MRNRFLLFGLGPLGCVPDPSCEGSCGETGSLEDTDAMIYSVEEPEPGWSAEQVGEQISAFVALGDPNPMQLAETYLETMREGDASCPGDFRTLENITGCTAEGGNHYAGIAYFVQSDWLTLESGNQVPLDWIHGGDFEVLRGDGTIMGGGGGVTYESDIAEDGTITFDYDWHGSWVDSARPDWLGVGSSAVMLVEGGLSADGTSAWMTMLGGVGLGDLDLHFNELGWDTTGACGGATTGRLHVREVRGYWYVWDLGDDCDSCGDVTFHGDQNLGELCLDLSAFGAAMMRDNAPRETSLLTVDQEL